jgi:hypothetical protein
MFNFFKKLGSLIRNWINQKISDEFKKKRGLKKHVPLNDNFCKLFEQIGEGTYLVSLKASKGFIGKLIGLFSNSISHTIIFVYSNKIKDYFNEIHWQRIKNNWNLNYNNSIPLTDYIKTLVVASADQEGMQCFDFSQYQNRTMTIRKLPTTFDQDKIILGNLANIIGRQYDFTGLIGWLFKSGDDAYSYYCSEECYDACKIAGIVIAENDNPSPGEIENYGPTQNWKIFDNINV